LGQRFRYDAESQVSDDPAAPGRRIRGAIEGVVSAGLTFDQVWDGWFGGAKIRYFGPRPLIQDNSVRSKCVLSRLRLLGYKFEDGLIVRVDGFNLLNQGASQIDYFYGSRLASETRRGRGHPLPAAVQAVPIVVDKAMVMTITSHAYISRTPVSAIT
jgi:hypothetical protein